MAHGHSLSLPAAILININIMMGAGIFINTVELAKRAGFLGSFMYPLIGLLVLPLILVIAQLISLHPSGGFYTFAAKEIHPIAGFISSWAYFTGKLASAMLMIHVAMSLCWQIIPLLQSLNIFILDILVLTLFLFLNLLNVRTGSRIQLGFLLIKLIPIFFIILCGLFFINPQFINLNYAIWSGIPFSLPLVIYAAAGFEATCSLSSKIIDAQRNGPRAIFISFGIVMLLIFLFQFLFYAVLGPTLANQTSYLHAFPAFLFHVFSLNPSMTAYLTPLFHLAIAASALGGSYGIFFSNSWNLYTLAQHGYLLNSSLVARLNLHMIPFVCIIVEGLFALLYLFITAGNQLPLQQISALASTISYSLSAFALIKAKWKLGTQIPLAWYIIVLSIFSCGIFIASTLASFLISGLFPLIIFATILGLGIIMYVIKASQMVYNK